MPNLISLGLFSLKFLTEALLLSSFNKLNVSGVILLVVALVEERRHTISQHAVVPTISFQIGMIQHVFDVGNLLPLIGVRVIFVFLAVDDFSIAEARVALIR